MTGDAGIRDLYEQALRWVSGLMRTVPAELLPHGTPCPDFSVRTLMGHLLGTAERSRATAQHRPTASIPHVVTDVDDNALADSYGALVPRLRSAWSPLDPREEVCAPWGRTSAETALWGFTTETLVHGRDLAVATGQPSEARPELAGPILAQAGSTVPASNRMASLYANVHTAEPDAGPTEQLANWLGHHR